MNVPSLLRLAEHQALTNVSLEGSVIDLGGDTRSSYIACMPGNKTVTTLNFSEKAGPDILHDLEQPLPIANAQFDHALLINVLEHIYDYRQLLREAVRVIRPGGKVVIVVPFLFPIHPSPQDFRRFSAEALRRECAQAGLANVSLVALGSGVFAARYVLLDRLLPKPLRIAAFYSVRYGINLLDALFTAGTKATRRAYRPEDYPLGYCAVGTKS